METGFKASRIISIGTAAPGYSSNQDTILNFMNQAYQEPDVFRKLRILFNRSGIDKRHSAIPDFSDSGQRTLFQGSKELPMLTERMDIFKQEALPLAISAVENAFGSLGTPVGQFGITHLITVSCTGMHSPGIDAEIMSQLNLSPDIFHISLNFMGCNAAFPALRIADSMIRSDAGARV